jgi:hypothetical protein
MYVYVCMYVCVYVCTYVRMWPCRRRTHTARTDQDIEAHTHTQVEYLKAQLASEQTHKAELEATVGAMKEKLHKVCVCV